MQTLTLKLGDCVQRMAEMPDNSVDAIVCDPPYGYLFMGRAWDDMGKGAQQREWHKLWLAQAFRVLKPGGHLLAFNGTRTHHHLSMAMEQVGFIDMGIRSWSYGSGFPKSLSVQKFLDKQSGKQGEILGTYVARGFSDTSPTKDGRNQWAAGEVSNKVSVRTAPATKESALWAGYGTALKPAWEPVIVGVKPC